MENLARRSVGSPPEVRDRFLNLLEKSGGEVVSRDVLGQACWNGVNFENNLHNMISQLRSRGFKIENVRGVGYRLIKD